MGALASAFQAPNARIGVITSAQLTTEELFLAREVLQSGAGARVTAAVPQEPGFGDEFLIKSDKNPNTMGATLLGLAGPGVVEAEQLIDDALAGNLDALWVMGHDLVELFGEDKVRDLPEKVGQLFYSGTNENPTADMAHWVLPSAAYVEKDGTFVNYNGRVQRIGRAFPPLADAREDWRLLLALSALLGRPLEWRDSKEIFAAIAKSEAAFAGLSYEVIGEQGAEVATARSAEGTATS